MSDNHYYKLPNRQGKCKIPGTADEADSGNRMLMSASACSGYRGLFLGGLGSSGLNGLMRAFEVCCLVEELVVLLFGYYVA